MSTRFVIPGGGLDSLRAGRVVAAATESFFGLLADASSETAISALSLLKPRADKGVPILLPNREAWATLVVAIPLLAARLADRFWPGPLSIALPARPEIDSRLVLDGTIAVRLGGPSPAAELARELGRPLTATSANLPGDPPAISSDHVRRAFPDAVARGALWVLDGIAPGKSPSTVVVVDDDALRIVREGAVSRAAIESLLE